MRKNGKGSITKWSSPYNPRNITVILHSTFFFWIEELKAHFNFTKTNCFVRDELFIVEANIFVKMIDTALQEHFNSPLFPKNLGIRNILYAELMEQNKREIVIAKNLHQVV